MKYKLVSKLNPFSSLFIFAILYPLCIDTVSGLDLYRWFPKQLTGRLSQTCLSKRSASKFNHPLHQASQEQLDSWQLGAKKMKKLPEKRLKLDHENNNLVAKIVFVARCDIHLEICIKILNLKWSRFGLITAGSSKTLFLCYAAVTHIPAQSF